MSSSVESRILTMKFENTAFRTGVTTTLGLLDKLKLSLGGLMGTKKIAPIDTSASARNLSTLGSQADSVASRFSAMSVVAVTAIATVAHSAVNAGIQLGRSLTVAPIMEGLREYETNLNSIQTILANTGLEGEKGLGKVEAALNELNEYSDKTIYNFSEMARNIGTFTAAGVDLDTSTNAIKGIANLAAVSGSNSQQASTAMYQLSQALAAGRVSLMDWNSVVNAGMGGKVFQEALKETARVHGVAVDDIIKSEGSFRESISKGWITSEILTETLSKFTGDLNREQLRTMGYTEDQIDGIIKMGRTATDAATKVKTMSALINTLQETATSGWAKTWSLLFGDFNEAREMFTSANDVLGGMLTESANRRNKMLQQWNRLGGRDVAIEGITNAFRALMNILTPVGKAFREVFPRQTGRGLYELTVMFRDFTEGLIAGKGVMGDIQSIFQVLFNVMGLGIDIAKGLIQYMVIDLIQLLSGGTGGVLSFAGSISDVINGFIEWIRQGDKIGAFFDKLSAARAAVFGPIIEAIGDIAEALGGIVASGAEDLVEWIQSLAPMAAEVRDFALAMQELISNEVSEFFAQLAPYADDARDLAAAFAEIAQTRLAEFFSDISDGLNNVGPMFASMGDSMRSAFGGLKGAAGGVSLGGMFDIGEETTAAEVGIRNVKDAIGETTSIADIASSAWDKVVAAFAAVREFLAPVGDAIGEAFGAIREKVGSFVSDLGIEEALALVNTGFFIAMYSTFRRFASSLGRVAESASGVLDQVTGNLKTMQTDVRSNIIMKIAASLLLLSASLLILSKIPADGLRNSLIAIVFLLGALVTGMQALEAATTLKGAAQMTVMSAGLIAMGLAILALSAAVAVLGRMDPQELRQGLIAVALILAGVTAASAVLEKTGGARQILIASAAIGVLSVALVAFAGALKLYASLDTNMMLEGGIKVAAAIAAIGLAMQLMPKNMLASAAGLVIVSASLLIIAAALKAFGSLSVEEMAKGLIMLGGSLLIIATAMSAMTGTAAGAAAMLLFAAALAVLVPSIVILGNLDISTIAIALGALAAIFLTLGLAAALIAPVVPVILALAAAIGLLGLAALAVGAGLLLFSAGLAALAVSGTAGIAVLTAAIIGIAELFPLIMQQVGLGIIAFAKVISTAGPALTDAFATLMISLLKAAQRVIPEFGKTLVVLIKTGIKVIIALIPDFVRTGFAILMGLLKGIRDNVEEMAVVAVSAAVRFLNGVSRSMDRIVRAGANLAEQFIRSVGRELESRASGLIGDVVSLGGDIVSGLARGIRDMGGSIVQSAIDSVISRIPERVRRLMGIASPSKVMRTFGRYISEGLGLGIADRGQMVVNETETVGNRALETIRVAMFSIKDAMDEDLDFSPVIAPVLDLTRMANEASKIGTLIDSQTISAGVSLEQASLISDQFKAAAEAAAESESEPAGRDITLIQNNHSPEALSTGQIYRNTKNQLSQAKEVLGV